MDSTLTMSMPELNTRTFLSNDFLQGHPPKAQHCHLRIYLQTQQSKTVNMYNVQTY